MLKNKAIYIVLILSIVSSFLVGFSYRATTVKGTAQEIARLARSIGLSENDPLIVRAKQLWTEADRQEQFERDRDIIATVIYNEAGYGCSYRHMELVAAVIYNRLNSNIFPDTVFEIVTAPGQYHPLYAHANSKYGKLARKSNIWKKCQEIATRALKGEINCPSGVVYQANFEQGSATYEEHKTSYSTTYFCYK